MSTEENRGLGRDAVEAFDRDYRDKVDRLIAGNHVDRAPSLAGSPSGPEGIERAWGMVRAAFPDLRISFRGMAVESDKAAVRAVVRERIRAGSRECLPPVGMRRCRRETSTASRTASRWNAGPSKTTCGGSGSREGEIG